MALFWRKRWAECAAVAGTVLMLGTAGALPASAADALPLMEGIYAPGPGVPEHGAVLPPAYGDPAPYDRPDLPQLPYRPGPYGQGSYAPIPSARFARPGPDARPVIPPVQIVSVLRSRGYQPLGQITQRGWIYTVAALDPRGDDGRLLIDARTGRILRFIPAMGPDTGLNDHISAGPGMGADYDARYASSADYARPPRPPAYVPYAGYVPSE